MRFTSPLTLLLLLLLPVFALLGWPVRGPSRRRESVSLGIRLVIAGCLILALAGLEIKRPSDQLAVVFLVDMSDSMPDSAQVAAFEYVSEALKEMGAEDQAAVIVFGGDALVERPMSASQNLEMFTSIPSTNQTDLAEAIRLALALYPPETARRLVVLSDGAMTSGDALAAARLAAASGVEVVVLPFTIATGPETMVTDVETPGFLYQGESFNLRFSVNSTEATLANVRILAGGQVVYEAAYQLNRGVQSFSVPLIATETGFINYTVQISTSTDGYYQNNELDTFSQVSGPPKILLVAPEEGESLGYGRENRPDEYSYLYNALTAAGFDVVVVGPGGLPTELPLLAEYASLVIIDVPARQFSQRQMLAVQSYVRDLGGGLVVVGGPTSYGVGGYFRTPLEETLPVEMQIKDELRRPTLTIVFIIDKSGSMTSAGSGVSKMELAKEAAIRSIELLFPTDRVGVIAFDESAEWVVPITDLSDPDTIINNIGSIRAGGGTDIMAGLQAMARVLPDDPATVKHVILLTDGGADQTGIPDLVERLFVDEGITLSAVAVGSDAAPWLRQIAQLGGGRYHFTADPSSIPSIFTEETSLATRSYIIEETFNPKLVNPSPILTGIHEAPPLHGYVGATTKDTAQTILASHMGDPILAVWQYGLGRAVAFTSDATGRWARDWVSWNKFPTFWAQAVSYTINRQTQTALSVRVELEGEAAHIIVNAQFEGQYLNGYVMLANVIAPDGSVQTIELQQTAPGRYEAIFYPRTQGAYMIAVSGISSTPGAEPVSVIAGWVLTYSPEYRNLQSNVEGLSRMAEAVGGRTLSGEPGEVFAHTLSAPRATRSIWIWLLTLAAVLLPLDIAVRRLVITAGEIRRGWNSLLERLNIRRVIETAVTPRRSRRMSSLLRAKKRAKEITEVELVKPEKLQSAPLQPDTKIEKPEPSIADAQTDETPPQVVKHPEQKDEFVSTTEALLARKRSKKDRGEKD